jgi:hypothetical protein
MKSVIWEGRKDCQAAKLPDMTGGVVVKMNSEAKIEACLQDIRTRSLDLAKAIIKVDKLFKDQHSSIYDLGEARCLKDAEEYGLECAQNRLLVEMRNSTVELEGGTTRGDGL